jgi:hypothetical protein
MAININTLFADIIDTPEQRQEKLLQQGMTQGRLLSSNLTGLARTAAPLAQMAGQLGVQRNEDLRRAVQPMLGLDPRTTGERLADQLKDIDTSNPQGLLKAAQAVQQIDPVRAAALRQAATEQVKADEDRERRIRIETMQIESAERAAKDEKAQQAARSTQAQMYRIAGMPEADVKAFETGAMSPAQMAELKIKYNESLTKNNSKIANMTPFTQREEEMAREYIKANRSDEWEEIQKLKKDPDGWWQNQFDELRSPRFTEADLFREAAVIQALADNKMMFDEAIDRAFQTLPLGGVRQIQGFSAAQNQMIGQQLGVVPRTTPQVNTTALAGEEATAGFSNDAVDRLVAGIEARDSAGVTPPPSAEPSAPREPVSFANAVRRTFGFDAQPASAPRDPVDRVSLNEALQRSFNLGLPPMQGVSPEAMRGLDAAVNVPDSLPAPPRTLPEGQIPYAEAVGQTRQVGYSSVPELANEPVSMGYQELVQATNAMREIPVTDLQSSKDKRNAGSFNDYLKATQELNFPVLPTVAKTIREIPAVSNAMMMTMSAIYTTLSSREGIEGAIDATVKSTLDSTANLVSSLVKGQSNTREQGEDLIVYAESAQDQLDALRKQLGRVSAPARKNINQGITALNELLKTYKRELKVAAR